jgi:hypothetical protein
MATFQLFTIGEWTITNENAKPGREWQAYHHLHGERYFRTRAEAEGFANKRYDEAPAFDRIVGLFVGQLDEVELALFEQAIKDGVARRYYDGTAGFLGLAKVGRSCGDRG